MNKDKDICKYYPKEDDDCVCVCGSDISGKFVCTSEYASHCQWAIEREDKMSSKKKKRRVAFLDRETRRIKRKEAERKHKEAMNTGDIEKMASAMELKVK